MAEDIANIGSRRNHKKTARWVQSVAQRSVPRQPLSPNVVIDPPANVTQDRVDKSISTYLKTTPLFQPDEGPFSTQLTDLSILKKLEFHKSIIVIDPSAPLTGTTFQQQGTSAFQNKNKSQSPTNHFRNRSAWRRHGSKQEFIGDQLEWPE